MARPQGFTNNGCNYPHKAHRGCRCGAVDNTGDFISCSSERPGQRLVFPGSSGPDSGRFALGKEYAAMNHKAYVAEAIGTFWLTFGGCGSAIIAAGFPQVGIGLLGVALAFGLTVVTMAYAIGHISGCHLNPAVSVGLWAGGRFPARDLPGYVIAQVLGAIAGAGVLYVIASGKVDFSVAGGFASNGYAEHSPGHYDLLS